MKINSLNVNCRQNDPVNGVCMNDYSFLFLRTPSVFRIDSDEHHFPEKTVIIYESGTPQFYRSASKRPLVCDRINFKMNFSEQQFFTGLGIPVDKPLHLSESIVIQNILKCIYTESVHQGKHKNEFADYALRLILIDISEQLSRGSSSVQLTIPHYKELEKLRSKIYSAPMNRWNIDEICSSLNISRTYFHRIYFSAFGVTCMQDVINSRLTCAGKMLLNTDCSVSSIAEQCGYDSDSYFMRQFKKHIGYTPSEYRRRFSAANKGDVNKPDNSSGILFE